MWRLWPEHRRRCVVLLAEDVDRNICQLRAGGQHGVVLLAEDVDRNKRQERRNEGQKVVLLAEDVDRNESEGVSGYSAERSSSRRRTWVEI